MSDEKQPRAPLFPEVLVSHWRRAATGILMVSSGKVRTQIYLENGLPIFAEGGALADTLGRLLVREQRITEEQYVAAIRRMTEYLVAYEEVRLGEVLTELGIMQPQEIYDALKAQVRQKILTCFQYERFDSEFSEGVHHVSDVPIFNRPRMEELLLAGTKQFIDPERLEAFIAPVQSQYPVLYHDVAETVRRYRMGGREQRLVDKIDGSASLKELRAASDLDRVLVLQILSAFVMGRAVELFETSPDTQSTNEWARAPDTGRTPAPAVGREAENKGKPVAEVLRSFVKVQPAARDEKTRRLQAEEAYQSGCRLMRQNLFAAAAKEFNQAVALHDGPEYRLYVAWAEYMGTADDTIQRAARAAATDVAMGILDHDRTHAHAHHVLGHFAKLDGNLDAAEKHFRAAAKNDPGDLDAAREVKALERRAAAAGTAASTGTTYGKSGRSHAPISVDRVGPMPPSSSAGKTPQPVVKKPGPGTR